MDLCTHHVLDLENYALSAIRNQRRRVKKRGEASLTKPVPPLLAKERGIEGVRLISKLKGR